MLVGPLQEVIVYVRDMNLAVRFYRELLEIPILYPIQDDYTNEFWVVLDTGPCKLCLHGGSNRQSGPDAPKIVFRVADIQQSRSKLADLGIAISEIRSPVPHVFVCDGNDPDGNAFSLEQS